MFVRYSDVRHPGVISVFFALNWYFHPSTSSAISVRADASARETSSKVTNSETGIHMANTGSMLSVLLIIFSVFDTMKRRLNVRMRLYGDFMAVYVHCLRRVYMG